MLDFNEYNTDQYYSRQEATQQRLHVLCIKIPSPRKWAKFTWTRTKYGKSFLKKICEFILQNSAVMYRVTVLSHIQEYFDNSWTHGTEWQNLM